MLTEDQIKVLSAYEGMFSSAINQNYISCLTNDIFKSVLDIYRSYTSDYYNFKIGCSNCVLSLFQKMGKIYFEQKLKL